MPLSDLTDRTAVLKAIHEADSTGREAFLKKYRFGPSREYFLEYNGKRYDSKAIVGAAYGYQYPERSALTAHDFVGGEKTVQPRLEALGFTVVVTGTVKRGPARDDPDWHLRPGEKVRRLDLHTRYGGSGQGGINPSRQSANVLVFTDPKAGHKFGYVFDGWVNGVFHYTGEGQIGDQLMRSGNRAIRDHEKNGNALRVFKGSRNVVQYVGEFRQVAQPYYAEAPDRNGDMRQVIVFQLVPIDSTVKPAPGPAPIVPAAKTSVTETSVAQHQTDTMTVQPEAEPRTATRREQPLVRRFLDYLERRGHTVIALRVIPEGETTAIVCDIYDKTSAVLYEAKGSGTRNAIRNAIGQLADYVRFTPTGVRCAVLLLERPRPDLERLLETQGIAAVWATETGFEDSLGGALISALGNGNGC